MGIDTVSLYGKIESDLKVFNHEYNKHLKRIALFRMKEIYIKQLKLKNLLMNPIS